jgi:prevent-host-death family protein
VRSIEKENAGDLMKVVAVREAKASLSEYIDKAQDDRVLITRHGKPAALVIGVEGEDLEDLLTMGNPRFWEMIEDRRREDQSLTLAEYARGMAFRSRADARSAPGRAAAPSRRG